MKKTFKSIRSFFRSSKKEEGMTKKEAQKEMKQKFNERFELGKTLGKGNFSVVRQATDKETGEVVAVKCISKRHLSKDDKAAIKQEVDILKAMNHPNIISLYGMFEDESYFYVVTELVKGGELFDRIVEKEFYSEKDAAATIKLIAEALKYCSENGVVHRDLKPENILLVNKDDDSSLKLADFGFAKEVNPEGDAELKTTCGTPGYVAPEIISGKPYGREVDMWSLGVIAYILLCGYPPFYDDNQANLFKLIRKAKYKFDPEFWEDVSEEAKDLIRGLLVVDRTARFNVEDVLNHPWIVSGGGDKDITPALDQLRRYQARRRLKKGVHAVMAVNRMKNLLGSSMLAVQEEGEDKGEGDEEEVPAGESTEE